MTEKSVRIIGLAKSGLYRNMTCVAEAAHVSREYVRLVLNDDGGFDNFGPRNLRLVWPCPDCGSIINLTQSKLGLLKHMIAHCRQCASNYCRSGRHNMVITGRNYNKGCLVCSREYLAQTVEIRTCERCRKPLEINRVVAHLIRNPKQSAKGKYHHECYMKIVGRIQGIRTHCRRNHEFTDENIYMWRGQRFCRACQRLRESRRCKKVIA